MSVSRSQSPGPEGARIKPPEMANSTASLIEREEIEMPSNRQENLLDRIDKIYRKIGRKNRQDEQN
jgi:hypothetical protein